MIIGILVVSGCTQPKKYLPQEETSPEEPDPEPIQGIEEISASEVFDTWPYSRILEESFEVEKDQTHYTYFTNTAKTWLQIDVGGNGRYIDIKLMEYDECKKQQQMKPYTTKAQVDHKLHTGITGGKDDVSDVNKEYCIAVTHSEATDEAIQVDIIAKEYYHP